MQTYETLKHSTWGMQISRGVDTEISEENIVWSSEEGTGARVEGVSEAEGM